MPTLVASADSTSSVSGSTVSELEAESSAGSSLGALPDNRSSVRRQTRRRGGSNLHLPMSDKREQAHLTPLSDHLPVHVDPRGIPTKRQRTPESKEEDDRRKSAIVTRAPTLNMSASDTSAPAQNFRDTLGNHVASTSAAVPVPSVKRIAVAPTAVKSNVAPMATPIAVPANVRAPVEYEFKNHFLGQEIKANQGESIPPRLFDCSIESGYNHAVVQGGNWSINKWMSKGRDRKSTLPTVERASQARAAGLNGPFYLVDGIEDFVTVWKNDSTEQSDVRAIMATSRVLQSGVSWQPATRVTRRLTVVVVHRAALRMVS